MCAQILKNIPFLLISMKHSLTITALLLGMFFLTQLVGLGVVVSYAPEKQEVVQFRDNESIVTNITVYHLPYGMEPPQNLEPRASLTSIIIALIIAILLMFLLMRLQAELFLRIWFFVVVAIAIGITFFAALPKTLTYSLITLLIALPLAYIKVFKRNIIIHNLTEVLIYPGIAAIFVPLVTVATAIILLILISLYDMYAVWHTGFMQRMAHYQIKTLKVFSGFFIPYLSRDARAVLVKAKSSTRTRRVKVQVAILGGGDVVFPIIIAGVVVQQLSFWHGLLISFGATLALALLFYLSKKGKFYPAMPFISIGCFVALALAYLM